ncbi:BAG domain-containing protein, partial [Aureobasidium melanogenum]
TAHSGVLQVASTTVNLAASSFVDVLQDTPAEIWQRAHLWFSEQDSSVLAVIALTAIALTMSWSSRFGSWSGRFSPFGRSGASAQVKDSDYSYITQDDLNKAEQTDASPAPSGPPRDTDVLVLKSKRISYPVHFPAYSIEKGELKIRSVREQAAKKTGADARHIKLFFRGKNMKEDSNSCRAEGLRHNSEIMCVVGDAVPESMSSSDSEDEEATADGADAPKRKRNRNKNKKKKSKKSATPQNDTSRTQSPRPPPVPVTPMDKLNAVNSTLQGLLPQCVQFLANPPADQAKKDFEHKRLSETILAQVLLKLDAVDPDGDPEARARRKELVKEAQNVLNSLDEKIKS